ncbi:MAG: ATP-binding cassette domain-containing protein [Bacteroidales bacterium]|nr:ATP-binding cassette domain-containing protein [Bacteroidales bacterium]
MNIVEVQEVTKRYSKHTALDNVSLSVRQGAVFGLLGPNGAGKTTLIRILNRITFPDQGRILFQGHPLQAEDVSQIGYLPEERGLYKKMKAGEQALYLAQLKGMSASDAKKQLKLKFEQYQISDWWNRPTEELSKGMQQKLQFIITILHKPSFLILDEPFSGFDPINTNLLKDEIMQLSREGATIILSTHNMTSVEEICDEIALINKSQKILEGNIYDIKQQFKNNTFLVEVANDNLPDDQMFGDVFQLVSQKGNEHTTSYAIRIADGHEANELIQLLAQQSHIVSFAEKLPSMNEIFIQQVETFNSQHHAE